MPACVQAGDDTLLSARMRARSIGEAASRLQASRPARVRPAPDPDLPLTGNGDAALAMKSGKACLHDDHAATPPRCRLRRRGLDALLNVSRREPPALATRP